MKRVYIVLALVVFITGICTYTVHRVADMRYMMDWHVSAITDAVERDNREEMARAAEELRDYWKRQEHYLVHFVRHTQVDEITKAVARLPSLATYADMPELMAELDSIRWQSEHVWESELPTLHNLL